MRTRNPNVVVSHPRAKEDLEGGIAFIAFGVDDRCEQWALPTGNGDVASPVRKPFRVDVPVFEDEMGVP
jgi:hypothetical protein